MKNNILIAVFALFSFVGFSQETVSWMDLADVEFEDKYIPAYDEYFLYPTFSDDIKALAGKEISITGYFLDIDPTGEIYVLSKGPMSSCFFCGVGGPETAVEIHFDKKPKFKTDDIITVTGKFELNSDDVEHFNYILKNCTAELSN